MGSLQTIVRKHRTSILGVEQRIHPRHPVSPDTHGEVRSAAGAFSCPARVRDLSLSGVSFVVSDAFRPGELLYVEFIRSEPDFSCTLLMRVIRSAEQADGDFVVGGQFVGELDPVEMKLLTG